jgi:hypothetical protein
MTNAHNEKLKSNPDEIQGNPRTITKQKIESICNLIRCGNYVKTSVKANDVNYNTFLTYMNKGKKGVEPYVDWYYMVEEAKAEAETGMVQRLHESASNGNVGVDMWMLSRMFPNRWGATKRQEIKVDNTQEIRITKYSDTQKSEK